MSFLPPRPPPPRPPPAVISPDPPAQRPQHSATHLHPSAVRPPHEPPLAAPPQPPLGPPARSRSTASAQPPTKRTRILASDDDLRQWAHQDARSTQSVTGARPRDATEDAQAPSRDGVPAAQPAQSRPAPKPPETLLRPLSAFALPSPSPSPSTSAPTSTRSRQPKSAASALSKKPAARFPRAASSSTKADSPMHRLSTLVKAPSPAPAALARRVDAPARSGSTTRLTQLMPGLPRPQGGGGAVKREGDDLTLERGRDEPRRSILERAPPPQVVAVGAAAGLGEEGGDDEGADLWSPRKKKGGYLVSGLAARASAVLAAARTEQTLWLHDMSRVLASSPAHPGPRDREALARALRPAIRLVVVEAPALALAAGPGAAAGGAEQAQVGRGGTGERRGDRRTLLARCRIVLPRQDAASSSSSSPPPGLDADSPDPDPDLLGLVLFSLHERASSSSSYAGPAPAPAPAPSPTKPHPGTDASSASLLIPTVPPDLRRLRPGAEAWVWDPFREVVIDETGEGWRMEQQQQQQLQHHQPSPARPLKRLEPDSGPSEPSTAGAPDGPSSSSAEPLAATTGPASVKRKITRRRQVFSCRACTTRKIRCEREGGPGTPCKACEKRGEAATCDAGTAIVPGPPQPPFTNGGGAGSSVGAAGGTASSAGAGVGCSDNGCAEHRDDLERRVQALEAAVHLSSGHHAHYRPRSSASRSAASANGFRYGVAADGSTYGTGDGPDSETEDAAMTLEDIAVNVRIGHPQPRRAGPSTDPVAPVASTSAQPLAPPPGVTRERASLLVPEISRRYRGVLADLYATLPSQAKMDWLVSFHFSSLSWFWVAHHAPTFLAEYDAFRHLLQEGKQFEVDPLWLSVLFLTLAHAANALDYVAPGSDFTADELTRMVPDFFEAARAALDCGDACGVARLRTIQAVVLLGPLALNSGDPGRVDVLLPYVASSIRVAQQLRLDKLGSDPTTMPPEDPALPTGTNTLRREVALRLFHALLHLDQVIFRVRPVLPLHLVSCSMPGNFDDKDLRGDAIVPPQPPSVRTITCYETLRFRVGMVQRAFHEEVILDPSYEYSTVLKNDTELRNLMAEYDLERPNPGETTPLYWARIFSLQNVNIRLIRFHRPFMSRGYREPAFRPSTDAALAAARVVLETQKELDRTSCPLVKDCYGVSFIQVAVVVLFLDIWTQHDPERQVPTADYRLVSDASLCFHRALGSVRPRVRAVARQSLLVIQCLFEALHARTVNGRKEPFGQLLKRVSVAVTEAERRVAAQANGGAGAGGAPGAGAAGGGTGADGGGYGYPTQVALPAPDPSTGDGRSLLLDVPYFAPGAANAVGGGPGGVGGPGGSSGFSGSPNELQFGDLTSAWGFDWMSLPEL